MAKKDTPGSFTKNFGWEESYEKLHSAIANGFSAGLEPVTRESWRKRSGIKDKDRQLIPMNFFLYSKKGIEDDLILVDRLVERAAQPYDIDFARLALFAFHLATSGYWSHSKWPDGRVACLADYLFREVAWKDGAWSEGALRKSALKHYIDEHVEAEPETKKKILNNYHYMLISAGVLTSGKIQAVDFKSPWLVDATQLFWDRQIFDGAITPGAEMGTFKNLFFKHEVHKLPAAEKSLATRFLSQPSTIIPRLVWLNGTSNSRILSRLS